MALLDDFQTLRRLRRGDRSAFCEVLDRHHTPIYRTLLYLTGGDADTAADLCQETFVAAWKALPTLRAPGGLRAWLHTIAVRTWQASLARPAAAPLDDDARDALPDRLPPTDTLALERLTVERLHDAVLRLPPRYRTVVVLVHLEQRTCPEVARLLGIPLGTVKSRLHTALAHLRRRLGEELP